MGELTFGVRVGERVRVEKFGGKEPSGAIVLGERGGGDE